MINVPAFNKPQPTYNQAPQPMNNLYQALLGNQMGGISKMYNLTPSYQQMAPGLLASNAANRESRNQLAIAKLQDAGATQRATLGDTGQTARANIAETGATERTTIGDTGATTRATIGDTGETTRTGMTESGATERTGMTLANYLDQERLRQQGWGTKFDKVSPLLQQIMGMGQRTPLQGISTNYGAGARIG